MNPTSPAPAPRSIFALSAASIALAVRALAFPLAIFTVGAADASAATAAKPGAAVRAGRSPSGDAAIRRYCLTIGSNFGGRARDTLLYAGSDAATFRRVLIEMGGVRSEDTRFLDDPSPDALDKALADLRDKVIADRHGSGRTEVVLYYSGHADARGLLLGEAGFDYDRFRRKIDSIPADVRIAVLDACASGAITRLKGGRHRPAFTVDASSDMRGYAFLTSSSPEEASQESDQIGSSFFTHYLVSGMRGAADVSGDGKVTLGEAYQFAFHETLARTERTKGGAQHPAYDMKLSGTGDVVMTDMRATSAGLVLGKDLEGRFFIRNPKGELVAELYKPRNRQMELGLPPGPYSIRLEQPKSLDTASVVLAEGGRETLALSRFQRMPRESTASRGGNVEDTTGGAAEAGSAQRATGLGFEYSDQIDLRAGMDPKHKVSLGLILNRQPRPFHGLQLAFFFNHASMTLWGGQLSVFGNMGMDSIQGGQTAVFFNLAAGGIQGFQGTAILNVADGVTGGQGSAVGNISSGDMAGGQGAAVFNMARNVKGGQGAAVANFALGSVRGGQGAAVMNVAGSVQGGQGAGVLNVAAGKVNGGQGAGVLNVARGVKGGQAAGVLNVSFGDVEGAQAAAVLNAGRDVKGAQVSAVVNAARDVKGAQVTTVFNAARDVDGCQVGLVNISRDIKNGIPFGLINYSHTGLHSANVWVDELGFQHFTLLSGSRNFYTYVSAGEKLTVERDVLILGAGMGVQKPIGKGYAAADMGVYDLHDNMDFDGPGPELYRLRVQAGRNLLPYLSVFGGLSLNVFWHQGSDAVAFPMGGYEWKISDEVFGWPGLIAGLRIGV